MKWHPIIFDAVSVNAILAGRKTQTRRVVNPQPPDWLSSQIDSGFRQVRHIHGNMWGAFVTAGSVSVCRSDTTIRCPYGRPGDRLWVRETWCLAPREDWEQWPSLAGMSRRFWAGTMSRPHIQSKWNGVHNAIFRADGEYQSSDGVGCWASPIHMPRWASRITLEVVAVRVERLQEITADDAMAEGISPTDSWKFAFAKRWDHINGKRAPWAANPFVWVIEFRRAEGGDTK